MSAPGVIADTMANLKTVKDAAGKEYTYKSKMTPEQKAEYVAKKKDKIARETMAESIAARKAQPLGEQVFFNPDILATIGKFTKGSDKKQAFKKQLDVIEKVLKRLKYLLKLRTGKDGLTMRPIDLLDKYYSENVPDDSYRTSTGRGLRRKELSDAVFNSKDTAGVLNTKIGTALEEWFTSFGDNYYFTDEDDVREFVYILDNIYYSAKKFYKGKSKKEVINISEHIRAGYRPTYLNEYFENFIDTFVEKPSFDEDYEFENEEDDADNYGPYEYKILITWGQ
jgi:hypothetical protein